MRVQFKFQQQVSEDERAEIIRSLSEHGAQSTTLVPRRADHELSTLYTVDTAGQASAQRLLTILNDLNAVESAETEPSRRLIWQCCRRGSY